MAMVRNMAIFLSALRKWASLWVSVMFIGIAVVLANGPQRYASPVTDAVATSEVITDTTAVRTPLSRAEFQFGRFSLRCNECHRSLPIPYVEGKSWTNHSNIRMAHGINKRCLNCHHPANREAFVDDDGNEIPWDQPQAVCSKCHGPVYRDWENGAHGRSNGYWDQTRGTQVRLKCIQCHDPHSPRFPQLASTPGPHSLRVHPHARTSHDEFRNPLRIKDNLKTNQYSNSRGENK